QGLDRDAAPLAMADVVRVILRPQQQTERFEIGDDLFARFVSIEAAIFFGRGVRDARVFADDLNEFQVVAAAHREIVRVVRGRDFDQTVAEILLDDLVLNEGRLATYQRQRRARAGEGAITFVFGVEGDGRIAEHRLGARRRDDDEVAIRRFKPA